MQCYFLILAIYIYVLLDEMFRIWNEGREFSGDLQLLWEFSSQHQSDSRKRFCLLLA